MAENGNSQASGVVFRMNEGGQSQAAADKVASFLPDSAAAAAAAAGAGGPLAKSKAQVRAPAEDGRACRGACRSFAGRAVGC